MPWTLLIVLFFFLLWLLLLVLFFLKTQQRVSVQVELSAFRGRWRVKKLDVTVDSNCNLLLGSAICVLCGLADKTATQTNTHTHTDTACTQLYTHSRRSSWKKSRASSEDNMEFIHSADSHLLNVFLTLCRQLDLRLARWWSRGGCEMLTVRACMRARLYQMQCVIQGVVQRQTTVGMVTTESAQVFMEIDPKWG